MIGNYRYRGPAGTGLCISFVSAVRKGEAYVFNGAGK